jgi:hypothetical protein
MFRDVLRGCYHTVRETLPDTVENGSAFLSGMVYGSVLCWLMVIVASCQVCSQRGGC